MKRPALPVETDRLRLRSLEEDDADRLFEIYGDAEAMRHVGRTGRPVVDVAAAQRAVETLRRNEEANGFSLWALDERDGQALIGVAGLALVDGEGPEIEAAYILRRDRWGLGLAAERQEESRGEAVGAGHPGGR